jgi:heptosyltransferase III
MGEGEPVPVGPPAFTAAAGAESGGGAAFFNMNSARGKILVIRGGAIGDFILTLPAIAALRRQFPGTHLEVLGYPHIVQLALAGGVVDRVESIEARALAGFFARNGALEPELTDYFSEFDLIVSYLFDPDAIFQGNVGRCSRAQFIVGRHRPDDTERIHAAKVYLQPLERLAIFDADPVPRIALHAPAPGAADRTEDGAPLRPLALHPGSGSERKNWPEHRWAELLRHLIDHTPLRFLLIGGEAEGDRLPRLAAGLPRERVALAQRLPLPELAWKLQSCLAFVGHDSGISHLSGALGLNSLILWSDALAEVWRPPQPQVVLLQCQSGMRALGLDQVLGALSPFIRTAVDV